MEVVPLQKYTSILRPRARIIKTIGEELISNDVVAIIELVKNSYDANASIIEIKFQGEVVNILEGKKPKKVLIGKSSSIIILDDGTGMNLDTVKSAWMEPATINKKNTKRSVGNKRRFTGEKGIGRFATAKLAGNLKMITKSKDDNEIIVDFDWSDFSDDTKYLDQIECSLEVREPIEITDSGTTLKLTELNSDWDEEKFRELRVALSRLINPVSPITDFLIDVQLPTEFEELSGLITSPESLNKPDYVIKGSLDSQGNPDLMFFSKKFGKEEQLKLKESELSLRDPIRRPLVGSFEFEFRIWNRDLDSIKKLASEIGSNTKNVKGDLDDLSGISIYRDSFRVTPYGNKNDDWLRLDIRRVNNPTLRLSNNQIVGYISISQDENPQLKDQSNREGIVESQAFFDLKELIKNILNLVEQKRYEERPRENDENKNQQSLFDKFSIDHVSQFIQKKLPSDNEAKEIIAKTEFNIQEGVKRIQEVLSRYRRLSTLGQLIDVVLHDGNNFLAKIDSENHLLLKEVSKADVDLIKVKERIKNINDGRKVLSQLFKRIEPFGGRKRGNPKEIIVEDAIFNVFEIYKNDLSKLNINITLPNSKSIVRIDEGELQIIFVNLLQNSIYWLETQTIDRRIEVSIEKTDFDLSIIFSDSGPGIKKEHYQLVFDPYFSTRTDGIGLGLTIIGELVTEYDGEFTLIENGLLDGATFKITFRKR